LCFNPSVRILDLSAGNRAIWFNRLHPETIFIDIRPEMHPTVVADTRELPFRDQEFDLVVFDPPHMTHGKDSTMAKAYTSMQADEIKDLIRRTSNEAYRCSTKTSLLAFKWNNHDVRLDHILPLMEGYEPLFGQKVAFRSARGSSTHWILLKKRNGYYEQESKMLKVMELDIEQATE
jgi:hypothetical protein